MRRLCPRRCPVAAPANGAIYQYRARLTLFDNAVAHRVGDMLTIVLQESTNASKSAVTTTKKATTEAMAGANLLGGAADHSRRAMS